MNILNSQLTSNGSNPKFKSTKSPNQKIQPKPNGISRPISHARIHKDSKQRNGERFTNQMESKNK